MSADAFKDGLGSAETRLGRCMHCWRRRVLQYECAMCDF